MIFVHKLWIYYNRRWRSSHLVKFSPRNPLQVKWNNQQLSLYDELRLNKCICSFFAGHQRLPVQLITNITSVKSPQQILNPHLDVGHPNNQGTPCVRRPECLWGPISEGTTNLEIQWSPLILRHFNTRHFHRKDITRFKINVLNWFMAYQLVKLQRRAHGLRFVITENNHDSKHKRKLDGSSPLKNRNETLGVFCSTFLPFDFVVWFRASLEREKKNETGLFWFTTYLLVFDYVRLWSLWPLLQNVMNTCLPNSLE